MSETKLAFVGCGRMGGAILTGLLRSGFPADHVTATVGVEGEIEPLETAHPGLKVTLDNEAAIAGADVIVVGLKPYLMKTVLDDDRIREAAAGKLVVSVAAGIRLDTLASWLPDAALVRVMPNTPSLIGEGMSVISPTVGVTAENLALVERIFSSVGRVIVMQPKHMDAVTALNGSGPAFIYVMLDALADGGVMMGLPRAEALEIAAQMMKGAAQMVLQSGMHPGQLKDAVMTPGGTTIAGVLKLEDGGIRSTLARAVQEASETATRLGKVD